ADDGRAPARSRRRPPGGSAAAGRSVMRLPIGARVLLRFTDPRVREYLAGDLEESFAALAATAGAPRARRWSVRQALAAALQHPWRPVAAARPRGDGLMRTF